MAFAPGVSAPQAEGFTAQEFLEMSEICGKSTDVVSVGYFETSPPHDRDQMTVRLVATAIHRMMIAFCSRK
jgi:formiminoglutamase/guanidinobutyrase